MIFSVMAFICVAAILYFVACLIVNWIQYEDEDGSVMKVTVALGIIYLVGLLSGWWSV